MAFSGVWEEASPQDLIWRSDHRWREVQSLIGCLLEGLAKFRRTCLEAAAKDLAEGYVRVFPVIEALCSLTCPCCKAPCCVSADARYDLRDLLFIHLIGAPIPLGQPRGDGHKSCRYLGMDGCMLPRISRPWMCTWYICQSQKPLLESGGFSRFSDIPGAISAVKSRRTILEDLFVKLTSPP